jgi:hypothetical protein
MVFRPGQGDRPYPQPLCTLPTLSGDAAVAGDKTNAMAFCGPLAPVKSLGRLIERARLERPDGIAAAGE